jgi:hypothetical protein
MADGRRRGIGKEILPFPVQREINMKKNFLERVERFHKLLSQFLSLPGYLNEERVGISWKFNILQIQHLLE